MASIWLEDWAGRGCTVRWIDGIGASYSCGKLNVKFVGPHGREGDELLPPST